MRTQIWALSFLAAGCIAPARYKPVTPQGNQCNNECVATMRSCEAGKFNLVCVQDATACRKQCFEFHGGEYTEMGFGGPRNKQIKDPPSTASQTTEKATEEKPSTVANNAADAQP